MAKGYYVIGGQYKYYCYGWTTKVLGAKRLARKHQEYWDNWQGWHTPSVYAAEDCEMVNGVAVPIAGAVPVAFYRDGWYDGHEWF